MPDTSDAYLLALAGAPTARVTGSYPVWFLSRHQAQLREAGSTGQIHCHIHHVDTAAGFTTYLRASARRGSDELVVDGVGDAPAAVHYVRAASAIVAPSVRLLLAPARRAVVFWDPDKNVIAVVAFASPLLPPGRVIDGAVFEAALAQIEIHPLFQRIPGVES